MAETAVITQTKNASLDVSRVRTLRIGFGAESLIGNRALPSSIRPEDLRRKSIAMNLRHPQRCSGAQAVCLEPVEWRGETRLVHFFCCNPAIVFNKLETRVFKSLDSFWSIVFHLANWRRTTGLALIAWNVQRSFGTLLNKHFVEPGFDTC